MYNSNNLLKLMNTLKWSNETTTESDIERRMNMLTSEDKHIIEIFWGLNGKDKKCRNYQSLNKKLGIDNGEELYKKAIKKLEDTWCYEALSDATCYPYEEAVNIGRLAYCVFFRKYGRVSGRKLKAALEMLTEREQKVIKVRFFDVTTREEAGRRLNLSSARIADVENRAIRRLLKKMEE